MDVLYNIKRECLRRGFSHRTVLSYVMAVKRFMKACPKDWRKVRKGDIRDYLYSMIDRGLAGSTLNIHLCALKFLFREVLHRKFLVDMRFSKRPKVLPVFLTKDEVVRLLAVVKNPKHKLILELLYSAGLRVSEAICLKKEDFDFCSGIGWVRRGKGNKDRPFIIAKRLRPRLHEYVSSLPGAQTFLFKGTKGPHITVRTVQEILLRARRDANILKRVHPHALRHSFATHLIENGYDVCAVQPLMGHSCVRTTMTYVHMAAPVTSSVRSPYDELMTGTAFK